jgi:hypothetical protein
MNEADRIMRERRRLENDANEQRKLEEEQTARERAMNVADQIRSEAEIVLELLERQGYPEEEGYPKMVSVRIEKPRFGMKHGGLGWVYKQVAGWEIATYQGESRGAEFTGRIFLLSDGTFNMSGGGDGNLAARDIENVSF